MKKKITEIEEMIRGILGRDKFLMLNMVLLKKLQPNGACFLTFLLDKYEFLVKSKQMTEDEGMSIYRREITQKLGLSSYQQRKIEKELFTLNLIRVQEVRVELETFNLYYFNILEIYNFVEE